MKVRRFFTESATAWRAARPGRLAILALGTLTLALASDWLREERVVFPAPLPKFTSVPANP